MTERRPPKVIRCAIYTRKSSEEGLEQDFNSLHAQREACEAFIQSQRHEGWQALSATYDDGGYSGGTMDRPALQKLLADIGDGSVDVVVVYKIDRLTRSLLDFAKIVETFDQRKVSFVSVTQQFNTTTSMGRLTLNVLLSFAQFEREVTGERIRDKIAASKKRGMWMGGFPPLGYTAMARSLVVEPAEAETVQTLFRLYLQLRNVRLVKAEADTLGLRTKRHQSRSRRARGGRVFSRGHIYRILSNPLYIGEIDHKGTRHAGQHPAIIDPETWSAAQTLLAENLQGHRRRGRAREPSLLAGLLFDLSGQRLTPTHASKNGKRYRYYVTKARYGKASRLPAAEIEQAVISGVANFLSDQARLAEAIATDDLTAMSQVLAVAERLAGQLKQAPTRDFLLKLIDRVAVEKTGLTIVLRVNEIRSLYGSQSAATAERDHHLQIEVPVQFIRRGTETRLVLTNAGTTARTPDPALLKAIARAHVWLSELTSGEAQSVVQIARRWGVTDRYVTRLLELAFLPPATLQEIMEGRESAELTAELLTRPGRFGVVLA